jgi:hypothetical protein
VCLIVVEYIVDGNNCSKYVAKYCRLPQVCSPEVKPVWMSIDLVLIYSCSSITEGRGQGLAAVRSYDAAEKLLTSSSYVVFNLAAFELVDTKFKYFVNKAVADICLQLKNPSSNCPSLSSYQFLTCTIELDGIVDCVANFSKSESGSGAIDNNT